VVLVPGLAGLSEDADQQVPADLVTSGDCGTTGRVIGVLEPRMAALAANRDLNKAIEPQDLDKNTPLHWR
jgi:hypothetical protein